MPLDFLGTVGTFLTGGMTFSGAIGVWHRYRENRRRKAAGMNLTVKDGVDKDWTRRASITLTSWTETPLALHRICIVWPPMLRADMVWSTAEAFYPSMRTSAFSRCHRPPRQIVLTPGAKTILSANLKVTATMKKIPRLASRVRMIVVTETIDGGRWYRVFSLRSSRVDWGKPPQE